MSDPNPPGEPGPPGDDHALAGEFVLRLLDGEAEADCAQRHAREPAFAVLVEDWRRRLAPLDKGFAAAVPSAALWARIETRLFGQQRRSLVRRIWTSAGLWRGASVVAAGAAIYLATVGPEEIGLQQPAPPEARLVSALATAESELELLAMLEPEAAVLTINRTSGGAAQGRSLELWLIEGEAAPVSLGVLPDTPRARVPLDAGIAARIGAGATLAITDEPEGGSPTGGPTGDVLATGEITEI